MLCQVVYLHVDDALHLITLRQMFTSVLDEILAIFLPVDSFIYRAPFRAIRALVVDALVPCLLLNSVAVVLPEISIQVRVIACLDNFGNGLHFPSSSRALCEVRIVALCKSR